MSLVLLLRHPPDHASPDGLAHASRAQGWAVLVALFLLTLGGIVLYLVRLAQAAP